MTIAYAFCCAANVFMLFSGEKRNPASAAAAVFIFMLWLGMLLEAR